MASLAMVCSPMDAGTGIRAAAAPNRFPLGDHVLLYGTMFQDSWVKVPSARWRAQTLARDVRDVGSGPRCRMSPPVTCPCLPAKIPPGQSQEQSKGRNDEGFSEQARGAAARRIGHGMVRGCAAGVRPELSVAQHHGDHSVRGG